MSQEVMEMQREDRRVSQAPPRSSPGPAPSDQAPSPLTPAGSGLASFSNFWTGSLVSVILPTLHHTQAAGAFSSLRSGLEEPFSTSVRKAPTPSFLSGSTLPLHFFSVTPSPSPSQTLPLLS